MPHRLLATMLVFLLVGIPVPARSAGTPNLLALGTVTQASGAHFNAATVSAGATIYDGDGLSTDANGALQFHSPASLVYLPGASAVTLHSLANGTQVQLRNGALVFSVARAAAMEILADEALIRPVADGPTIAQVTLIGPKELQVRARRGTLWFSYRNEAATIPEGASYSILLDPPEASSMPQTQRGPVKAGHENRFFKIISVTTVALITVWAVHEAFESPDRP